VEAAFVGGNPDFIGAIALMPTKKKQPPPDLRNFTGRQN
jgi:hypothetical protein